MVDMFLSLIFIVLLFLVVDGMGAFGSKWRLRNFLMDWLKNSGS